MDISFPCCHYIFILPTPGLILCSPKYLRVTLLFKFSAVYVMSKLVWGLHPIMICLRIQGVVAEQMDI